MSDPEVVDSDHLLSPEAWAEVVAQAAVEAERIAAGHPPEGAHQLTAERYGTGVAAPLSGSVFAPSNGGRRPRGAPTFGVLHSAETPLSAGYAASIARYFAGGPGTSCHYMTDPAETWGVLPDELVAWHVGGANTNSIGLEQAGYARFTRDEWLTPAGMAQLERNAAVMRACRDRYGIGLHWMTDAELLAAHRGQAVGGWATHDQCRRVIGGTTHTDPGGGFPLDVQMKIATQEADSMTQPLIRSAVFDQPIAYVRPDGAPDSMTFGAFCQALIHRTQNVVRDGAEVSMLQEIADAKTNTNLLRGELAGLAEALRQLAAAPGQAVDLAAVKAAAREGAESGAAAQLAKGVDVHLTVGGVDVPATR